MVISLRPRPHSMSQQIFSHRWVWEKSIALKSLELWQSLFVVKWFNLQSSIFNLFYVQSYSSISFDRYADLQVWQIRYFIQRNTNLCTDQQNIGKYRFVLNINKIKLIYELKEHSYPFFSSFNIVLSLHGCEL